MSKYKPNDQFIIEIESSVETQNGDLYRIANFNSWVNDSALDRLNRPDNNYDKGFKEGAKALLDALTKIADMNDDDIERLFRVKGWTNTLHGIISEYSADEIVTKMKEYEVGKIDLFRVGDEVQNSVGDKYIVTKLYSVAVGVIQSDGRYEQIYKKFLTRTGRTYPIKNILEAMNLSYHDPSEDGYGDTCTSCAYNKTPEEEYPCLDCEYETSTGRSYYKAIES